MRRTFRSVPGERIVFVVGEQDAEHDHHRASKRLLPRLLRGICNERRQASLLHASSDLDPGVEHEEEHRRHNYSLAGCEAGHEGALDGLAHAARVLPVRASLRQERAPDDGR